MYLGGMSVPELAEMACWLAFNCFIFAEFWNVNQCVDVVLSIVFDPSEPEDEDVDKARDILLQPATDEHNKGEHRDLFFFIGADVSYVCM